MKTLDELKEFQLEKEDLNELNGGYDAVGCAGIQEDAARYGKNFTDADWDAFAKRFDEWCV